MASPLSSSLPETAAALGAPGESPRASGSVEQGRGWKDLPLWILAEAGVVRRAGLIEIPYRKPDGSEHARRIVRGDGKRWWRPAGRGVFPFGIEMLCSERTRKYRVLAITEGESDALAIRAHLGYHFDVIGVPGASAWRDAWSLYADLYDAVYIFGDADESGLRFAWKVAATILGARVVELPEGEDVRSILQGPGTDALLEAVNASEYPLRLRKAFHLATDLESCEALLWGEIVPFSRLDPYWVERYGLREGREVAGGK